MSRCPPCVIHLPGKLLDGGVDIDTCDGTYETVLVGGRMCSRVGVILKAMSMNSGGVEPSHRYVEVSEVLQSRVGRIPESEQNNIRTAKASGEKLPDPLCSSPI